MDLKSVSENNIKVNSNNYPKNEIQPNVDKDSEKTINKTEEDSAISKSLKDKLENKKDNKEQNDVKDKKVNNAIEQMNDALKLLNRKLTYKMINKEGNGSNLNDSIYVALIDKDTEKVIKEIPPKEFIEMRERIKDFVGMLIDEKR